MIWIYRGRGAWALYILILFIAVPFLVAGQLHLLPKGQSTASQIFIYCCLLAAGLAVTALGFRLNVGAGSWKIDPASGIRYFDKSSNHSMYFVPLQYWGLLYTVAAITLMALKALKVI